MSLIDTLKSGAESLVGAAAQKIGIDPAQAEAILAKAMPGDATPATEAAPAALAANDTTHAPADATAAAREAVATSAPTSLFGKVNAMLDHDGDGNALNDITNMASKLFSQT